MADRIKGIIAVAYKKVVTPLKNIDFSGKISNPMASQPREKNGEKKQKGEKASKSGEKKELVLVETEVESSEPAAIPAPGKTMGEYLVERSQLQNKIITLVESGTGLSLLYKEIIEEPNVNAEAKWEMYEEKQTQLRVLLTEFDALKEEATKQNPDSSMQFRELAGRRFYEELVKFSRDAMDR